MMARQAVLGIMMASGLLLAAVPVLADTVVVEGAFVGASGHRTSGTAQLIKREAGGYAIRFGTDFVNDGAAPDPTVGLGKHGYDKATNVGKLSKIKGAQDYALPAGFDPTGYDEIYVWCTEYAVPLGIAKVK